MSFEFSVLSVELISLSNSVLTLNKAILDLLELINFSRSLKMLNSGVHLKYQTKIAEMKSNMEALKLFYPSDFFLHAHRLGVKEEFHWSMCGKKIWSEPMGGYILEITPRARFYGLKSGKSFIPKEALRVLLLKGLPKSQLKGTVQKVRNFKLDGVALEHSREKCSLPLCSAVDFIFLPGSLKEVDSSEKCPLVRFVKRNNTFLRSQNPEIPTCEQLDRLLKKNSSRVCHDLNRLLCGGRI